RCLGCMACMTACPSGVQYDQIIAAAREWTEAAGGELSDDQAAAGLGPSGVAPGGALPETRRPLRDRLTRAGIFALFPYPARLRVATAPLRALQRTGADRLIARTGLVGRVSPAAEQALRLAPPAGKPAPAGRLPERVAARGARRAVVGMLTGCVQSVFFPRAQGCCGALSLHSGRAAEAVRFARRTIETFEAAGVDAIVVNSAGCGSA